MLKIQGHWILKLVIIILRYFIINKKFFIIIFFLAKLHSCQSRLSRVNKGWKMEKKKNKKTKTHNCVIGEFILFFSEYKTVVILNINVYYILSMLLLLKMSQTNWKIYLSLECAFYLSFNKSKFCFFKICQTI